VNVTRDDFPQDANMRAFEAMAAGSLLISRMPTELTTIGFQEGVHFVGYRDEREIIDLVTQYLCDEQARRSISQVGRHKVLTEHTYDSRVNFLLDQLARHPNRLFAPARQWTADRFRLSYLDYYASHQVLRCARIQLQQIAQLDLRHALAGGALLGRAWARELRQRVKFSKAIPTAQRERIES
jgi:hypothetical protein